MQEDQAAKNARRLYVAGFLVALLAACLAGVHFDTSRGGFVFEVSEDTTRTTISVTLALVVLTCFYLAKRYRNVSRERKLWAVNGRCSGCGYDLGGSQKRCPECGQRIDPRESYPALVRFFGVHFWEKWQNDADDDRAVIENAVTEEPQQISRITLDLEHFFSQAYTEEEAEQILRDDFRCHFDPRDHGVGALDWLENLYEQMRAAASTL